MDIAEIRTAVRAYIAEHFLRGADAGALGDETPLISAGLLDSVATLDLVSFLEETYGIELEAHEIGVDTMNTVDDIARLVAAKAR